VESPDYPLGLRDLADAPGRVFVRGRVPPHARSVAVVGSRAASPYGLGRARELASDLARLDFTIVSGLARGIDAAAHRGALDAGGTTVAVLPGGLESVTPRHHLGLAEEIAERGGLLSEWPSGEPPRRRWFVRRNRLIAALGAATVVVEAAERSGALSTAGAALRLGRPVLAVPGDVDRVTSRGCNDLLRQGAQVCEGAFDVLRALEAGTDRALRCPAPPKAQRAGERAIEAIAGGTMDARLAASLARGPQSAEALAAVAGVPLAETLAALLRLEWAGVAQALPGQKWTRRQRVTR